MEPTRNHHATLVDLLDRVLDKGLVINADIIISVAGIPLIGVSLRAALAGMETMVRYGIMKEWDESTRAWEREHRGKKEPAVTAGEGPIQEMRGAYCCSHDTYTAWRMGRIRITKRRVILYHPAVRVVLFQTALDGIRSMTLEGDGSSEAERSDLCLLLEGGHIARLQAADTGKLKEVIEAQRAAVCVPRKVMPLPISMVQGS